AQIFEMGGVLVAFSGYLIFLVSKEAFSPWLVVPVIVGDLVWVVMSLILSAQFSGQFTIAGLSLVLGVALVVLLFADLQALGLYRHRKKMAMT
ncbi:MAG: hypothetical protein AAF438_05210, partial [Pseudomonadota bacterium]